ncbi:mycothiol system anti-sigma-R factor [Actinobaculum massiliense]|uniref:TIGR02949 family anti-sigma factor n=1 Tax=Actinobaculum massiliense ACS-171-V-Col2 TaxID=883066 RepID=K9EIA6_9ACTO|nr:mycothiol system anti-sigma-R factor [Actinobaculum massiliense]EKU95626.1 TIGR02949 family anti-sigma factor [Actinobaculum massiliense ACS-171-V-Col2]MDK8318997.1 mycothiol system anti-sigma-R factor [Actinobaculum massiliense]MDK8567632.1 mycothiol system anti-sigma-R factor [Actinobaculum massiliense]
MSSEGMWTRLEDRFQRAGLNLDSEDGTGECSCSELAENLFEFLDHQIPRELERRLERHIAGCADCQDRAEAEEHVRTILKSSCAQSAPATLRVRIAQQIAVYKRVTY